MREIVVTADGTHTISIPEQKVTYHFAHGAVQESMHAFIEAGLNYCRTVWSSRIYCKKVTRTSGQTEMLRGEKLAS